MGASGVGIFDDDLAADVRAAWREAVLDGDGTPRVLDELAEALDDPDEAAVFWLALALAQHETGRLEDDVRDRALAIIEAGGDSARWDEAGLGTRRRRVLESLAKKLRGPQPNPKKLRRPRITTSPLEVGDVVRVRGELGRRDALLVAVAINEDAYPKGTTEPVLASLLWDDGEVPDEKTLAGLPLLLDETAERQMLHVVGSPSAKAFDEAAEIVARGVVRDDAADHRGADARHGPNVGYCTWEFVRGWIEGPWYDRCVAATKQRL